MPDPDPVHVRRARAARLAELGQRIGNGLFGLAVAVFVVGFGVKAAERDEREGRDRRG
jgi:acyl dehydratase